MLDWILFAILGWKVFAPEKAPSLILLIIFIVLMLLWLVGFFSASSEGGWNWGMVFPHRR